MVDSRQEHHITVLGAEAWLALDLQAALQRANGSSRFVVASRPDLRGLDPGECELLIVDLDGQAGAQLELLTQCRRLHPYLPALVLVGRGDTPAAVAAMKAGATDCLEKPLTPVRLWSAVTTVLGNGPSSRPQVCQALTKAEIRVLHLLLAGKTNVQIAEQFHRSRRTVEAHRRNIMRKLGAAHICDLVKQAVRMQYIPSILADSVPPVPRTSPSRAKTLELPEERAGGGLL